MVHKYRIVRVTIYHNIIVLQQSTTSTHVLSVNLIIVDVCASTLHADRILDVARKFSKEIWKYMRSTCSSDILSFLISNLQATTSFFSNRTLFGYLILFTFITSDSNLLIDDMFLNGIIHRPTKNFWILEEFIVVWSVHAVILERTQLIHKFDRLIL